jgi:hypothetical protein
MPVDIQANSPDSSDAVAPNVTGTPTGLPTSPTPIVGGPAQEPQPTAPPKETFRQGMTRGATGDQFLVDGRGNVVSSRATARSAGGDFGSILSGIVFGALSGAKVARSGRVPSQATGGGFGGGVAAAAEDEQQRDQRNRAKAQQDFTNRNQAQKMSRESAESAAVINHLSAQTASELSATQRANEEHPLNLALKKAGLDEAAQSLQKGYQDLAKNSLGMMQTLTDSGIDPSAMPTNWTDAKPHVSNIVQGRSVPLHNGETGEDQGAGIFDVQQLRQTPLVKPAIFKTYTADRDGNPIEKINTLPAGTSAFDYVQSAMAGKAQLRDILSQQAVKQATEVHKATIREKNAATSKDISEGNLANAKAKATATGLGGVAEGSEGLHGEDYLRTLPTAAAGMVRAVGEGRQVLPANRKDSLALLEQVHQAYPDWDESLGKTWGKTRNEYTGNGKTAQSLIRANTALTHAQELYDQTTAEGVFNPLSKNYADRQITLGLVKDEIGAAVKGGIATEGEGKELLASLSGGLTIGAKRERIAEVTRRLHDRIEATQDKFEAAKPSAAIQVPTLISPRAAQSYDYIQSGGKSPRRQDGNSQSQRQQTQPTQPQPPNGATMRVPGSDGKLHWSDGKQDLGVAQ